MWVKNLKYLRHLGELSQQQLAEKLDINRSRLRDYELGLAEPKLELLVKISDYFDRSLDSILREDLATQDQAIIKQSQEQGSEELRVLVISENAQGNENIIHVPVKAQAGYLNGYGDPEFIDTLAAYHLPGVSHGTYRSFEIEGDSMLPLPPGTVIVGKYVESWRDITNNKTYILVTKNDGIVYKRVINRVKNKGLLVLLSDNPAYAPYQIPIEEVQEAWCYYCHLSNAGSEQKNNLDQLLQTMEELKTEVSALKEKI